MLILLFFFLSIQTVASISNQEDLSITNYSHIGCLQLRPQKEFVVNYIQQNPLSPYQTFSSSNLTIQLCFRLCRRWVILINKDQTNCICLYTISKPYQLNDQLGEVLSTNNCTANDLLIYSLTKDFNILPSVSRNYDWSLDGCYYLHGIQSIQANVALPNDVTYTNAIDSCRNHCQKNAEHANYYSFFLSLNKSCYCLPVKTTTRIGARKPLVHCSFLSYIKNGFEKSSVNYSEIHRDTVIKIDVTRYCSSTFIFDRTSHLCLKSAALNPPHTTYMNLNTGEFCSAISIRTYEQWNHLISLESLFGTRTFIWIDMDSTYLFEDLFPGHFDLPISDDLCIVINRTESNRSLSYNLVLCSAAKSPGFVLCSQKPLETIISDQAEFKMKNNDQLSFIVNNLTCPPQFVLFNKICYFVPTSFVYDTTSGEHLCTNQYSNSTLVKFNSHEWRNVDMGRFLGRTMNDVLLEFFYYQLEEKMANVSTNDSNKKHWLRLLLGNKTDNNECILRYFTRSSGVFTILDRCTHGGHPVCQCDPILKDISVNEPINNSSQIKNDSSKIDISTESTTTTQKSSPISLNSTDLPIQSNKTMGPICDNCTTMLADEDIPNKNNIEFTSENDDVSIINNGEQPKKNFVNYQQLLMIVIGSLLASVIIITAIGFVIRYVRRNNRGRNIIENPSRRLKPSSTNTSSTVVSNTPTVHYTRLKSNSTSGSIDPDMINLIDYSVANDYEIPLIPNTTSSTKLHEYIIKEDDDETYYASLKDPYLP